MRVRATAAGSIPALSSVLVGSKPGSDIAVLLVALVLAGLVAVVAAVVAAVEVVVLVAVATVVLLVVDLAVEVLAVRGLVEEDEKVAVLVVVGPASERLLLWWPP